MVQSLVKTIIVHWLPALLLRGMDRVYVREKREKRCSDAGKKNVLQVTTTKFAEVDTGAFTLFAFMV